MSLDCTGSTDCDLVLPTERTPLDIVADMRRTLASPARWCREHLARDPDAGPDEITRVYIDSMRSGDVGQHCLYGALNLADHGDASFWCGNLDFATTAGWTVHDEIKRHVSPTWMKPMRHRANAYVQSAGIRWNREQDRSHEGVMALLDALEARFLAAEAVDADAASDDCCGFVMAA